MLHMFEQTGISVLYVNCIRLADVFHFAHICTYDDIFCWRRLNECAITAQNTDHSTIDIRLIRLNQHPTAVPVFH